MDYYAFLNVITYLDIDSKILMKRINKQFNQHIGQIKVWDYDMLINVDDNYRDFIGLRIGSYRMSQQREAHWMFWSGLLFCACYGGYRCLINQILRKDNTIAQVNKGLLGACFGGHLKIVNLMIENGANDLIGGFDIACSDGHNDIVKLMIEKGADCLDHGFRCACSNGHINIVKFLIEKGVNSLNYGFEDACFNGHVEIAKLLIEKGVKYTNTEFMCGFTNVRHINIAKLFIEHGANDWNNGLHFACLRELNDMVKLMIEMGATECSYCHKSIEEHLHMK